MLERVPPVSFYETDLGRAFVVDLHAGAKEVELPEAECVVSLASQVSWYTFAMRFGLPTLGVSGRFKINHSEPALAALKNLALHTRQVSTPKWHPDLAWAGDCVSSGGGVPGAWCPKSFGRIIVGATLAPSRNAPNYAPLSGKL